MTVFSIAMLVLCAGLLVWCVWMLISTFRGGQ